MKLKPGHSTTEFYITIIAGLVAVALDALGHVDGEMSAGFVTVLGVVYTVMRGKLKIAIAQAEQPKPEATP